MRNATGVDADQGSFEFEGFEQRLLDELKIMVTERRVERIDAPVPGRSPSRRPVWRRVGLVGAVGLAAGSISAVAIFAGGLISRGSPASGRRHVELALTSFLNKAATAARSHPVALPKPGQVFVERVKSGDAGPNTHSRIRCYVMVYDTPATGKGSFPSKDGNCGSKLIPFEEEKSVYHHLKGGGTSVLDGPDHGAHGYPDPARLPANPKALLAALDRAARGHWDTGTIDLGNAVLSVQEGSRNLIVFGLIMRLLQVPIRPALRAALFEVTGHLHGIKLIRHTVDLIGRPGVGISLPFRGKDLAPGLALEYVVDAKTYQFLGVASINGNPANPYMSGYAVIKSFLVTPKH